MSFNKIYKVVKDYNVIFDEKGATYGTLRQVKWLNEDGSDEDKVQPKFEIRKMYNSKGEENFGKGYTFSSKEGVDELAEGLVENDFGDTNTLLKSIIHRDDFEDAVKSFDGSKESQVDGEYFDMRDLLKFEGEDDEQDSEEEGEEDF